VAVRTLEARRTQKTVAVATSGRQPAAPAALRTAPSGAVITAPTALATSPFGDSLRVLLNSTATWLAGLPANPITDALQGAVWSIRRTLFPATVGVVTAPIKVPLTQVAFCFSGANPDGSCSGTSVPRLGIWLTLGSGNTIPQFFEFDTGSAGFLAAYASSDPSASPWWGSVGVVTPGKDIDKKFDSGTEYKGVEAITTVSFYKSATDVTPLLSTGQVKVGQVDEMTTGTDKDKTTLWGPDGSDGPPIDGLFYGDFGASPTYESNGITNVLNELTFARGVQPGFRVNYTPPASPGEVGTWELQIGLRDADVDDPAGAYFAMVPDASAPGGATNSNSGTSFFAQQLFLATVHIAVPGTSPISDVNVGITPDTGADTTVHNTDRSSQSSAITYAGITHFNSDGKTGTLGSGLPFTLSGTTTSGESVPFFTATTDDEKDGVFVNVQNGTSAKEIYYVNTGIQLFFQNDVVYDMRRGRLGLIPVVNQ